VKELVEMIAKALVDNPDKVQVSQLEGEQTTILELKVAPEDLGKVIGKQGRTARAIRVILGAAGMKMKRRFNLEIIEKADLITVGRIIRGEGKDGTLKVRFFHWIKESSFKEVFSKKKGICQAF